MSKSEASKLNYVARRELRLRRDKAAALALQGLLTVVDDDTWPCGCGPDSTFEEICAGWAKMAVAYADALIAELDRTRPDLKVAVDGPPPA